MMSTKQQYHALLCFGVFGRYTTNCYPTAQNVGATNNGMLTLPYCPGFLYTYLPCRPLAFRAAMKSVLFCRSPASRCVAPRCGSLLSAAPPLFSATLSFVHLSAIASLLVSTTQQLFCGGICTHAKDMCHPHTVCYLNDGGRTFLLTAGKQLLVGHGS